MSFIQNIYFLNHFKNVSSNFYTTGHVHPRILYCPTNFFSWPFSPSSLIPSSFVRLAASFTYCKNGEFCLSPSLGGGYFLLLAPVKRFAAPQVSYASRFFPQWWKVFTHTAVSNKTRFDCPRFLTGLYYNVFINAFFTFPQSPDFFTVLKLHAFKRKSSLL